MGTEDGESGERGSKRTITPATRLIAEVITINFFFPIFLVIFPTSGIISKSGR